jgi:hypothetical protein
MLTQTQSFHFKMTVLVRIIHGKNAAAQPKDQVEGMGTKDATKVIEITENDNDISVLTSKTLDKLSALLAQETCKSKSTVDTQGASGSKPPVSGVTANATPTRVTGTAPIAAEGPSIPPSIGTEGRVNCRLGDK